MGQFSMKITRSPGSVLGGNQQRDFMHEHGSALVSAAHLLGGSAARGRVLRFIEAVKESGRLTRAHRRELSYLHYQLSLENVGNPGSLEAALFAEIDLSSPEVEDICLLTYLLTELLERIAAPEAASDAATAAYLGDAV
ncbi:hypothetical protein [Alloyangia pacifica]|nr:hypothetical protein [Alloyangia pacifica]